MNSFSLLKLIIPTLKATNKLYQPHSDNTHLLKHLYAPLASLPEI
jgi:pyruvate dehydrogenase phosphatase